MERKAIIIFLLLSYISVSSYTQQNKVDVTYVGNAGFLLNIGDKKILIDALFKGFEGNYQLPQEVQDKLTLAKAPFDNVDLILVTHAHYDHFSAPMVAEYLSKNITVKVVCNRPALSALKGVENYTLDTSRIVGLTPDLYKSIDTTVNNIDVSKT